MTRLLVAVFAISLGVLALSATPAKAETKVPKDTCVKPCQECAKACIDAMKHAQANKMEGMAKATELCHLMCLTCANAVAGGNPRSWAICELCENICNDCAAECEKINDEHAKKCAKACRDCAVACANARK